MPTTLLPFVLVAVALALLVFIYTERKHIPTLGCILASVLVCCAFLAAFVTMVLARPQ